jgi:hypothetical protein
LRDRLSCLQTRDFTTEQVVSSTGYGSCNKIEDQLSFSKEERFFGLEGTNEKTMCGVDAIVSALVLEELKYDSIWSKVEGIGVDDLRNGLGMERPASVSNVVAPPTARNGQKA